MKETADELQSIINDFAKKLTQLNEADFQAKPLPTKWSKKEVLGHLIDSAHNNLRRFIVGQYNSGNAIAYEQDFWVHANKYQDMKSAEIILLWKLINERIVAVLRNMPEENYSKEVNTAKEGVDFHTLEWLAADYVKHLKHHLNQVFANSFDLVYP